MGTVLSFSPKNNHYDENNGTVPSVKEEKSMKKHGIFLNGLSWKSFGHKNSAINHQTNNQYPTQQAFKGNKLKGTMGLKYDNKLQFMCKKRSYVCLKMLKSNFFLMEAGAASKGLAF